VLDRYAMHLRRSFEGEEVRWLEINGEMLV